ncbi:MAG: endonuclease III domain-containing protein [Candidatus Omnitrophica bacterium]|nr:endonuclease III domain-containing protein [Candidatus Omnitrophota bacterium]MDD5552428.1 endonuclease III domain-containing protein [Candidatus Omnitrophota bacterium]
MTSRLNDIYRRLYVRFGPQKWWPAESPFEVMVGAILTQNTNWLNVERAINNIKKNKLLSPRRLYELKQRRLASLIKPAGYYNIKAKRLRNFLKFFIKDYQGSALKMSRRGLSLLRQQLLGVNGIGPETADSILLYALNKPVFVVDAYTKRILFRHGFIGEGAGYDQAQNLFMQNLEKRVKLYNEYHALIVRLGKEFCRKNNPRCRTCPLKK